MRGKFLFNEKLANDYIRVVIPYSKDFGAYLTIRRRIALAEVDICNFFYHKGSLEKLEIEGIGKNTKQILEMIIEKGVDEVAQLVQKKKKENYQRELEKIWKDMPRDNGILDKADDTSMLRQHYWDDIIKILEGDL